MHATTTILPSRASSAPSATQSSIPGRSRYESRRAAAILCSRTSPTRVRSGIPLYSFTPADQFDVHGTYVTQRTTRDGLGAPVVAVGREANQDARANFSLPRTYYGVTAIARFEGRRCVLSFEDPL